jgi:hypothetical protein
MGPTPAATKVDSAAARVSAKALADARCRVNAMTQAKVLAKIHAAVMALILSIPRATAAYEIRDLQGGFSATLPVNAGEEVCVLWPESPSTGSCADVRQSDVDRVVQRTSAEAKSLKLVSLVALKGNGRLGVIAVYVDRSGPYETASFDERANQIAKGFAQDQRAKLLNQAIKYARVAEREAGELTIQLSPEAGVGAWARMISFASKPGEYIVVFSGRSGEEAWIEEIATTTTRTIVADEPDPLTMVRLEEERWERYGRIAKRLLILSGFLGFATYGWWRQRRRNAALT